MGNGVNWLKSHGFFTKPYYPYDTGSLLSVKASKHITVGKNLFGGEYNVSFPLFLKKGTVVTASAVKTTENVPFIYYYDENDAMIDYWGLSEIDGNRNKRTFTIDRDCYSVKFTTAQCSDMQIEFGSSMTAYEPYISHEYTLDDIELRGILKLDGNNNLYYDGDTYSSSGDVDRRFEYRAYASGDESLPDTITDGTNTVTKLATPTTETADTFTNPQICEEGGTEEYIDGRTVEMPVGHDTIYGTDMVVKSADFGATVYGGTYNLTTGVLTSTKNADGTDKNPPDVYNLTPLTMPVNSGDNYVLGDTNGDAYVKYYKKA